MPKTLKLIDEFCTTDSKKLKNKKIQTRHHTFTCYKKNNKNYRFGAPFWPMQSTTILIPMSAEDGRRKNYKSKFMTIKDNLEKKKYNSFEDFWAQNSITSMEH